MSDAKIPKEIWAVVGGVNAAEVHEAATWPDACHEYINDAISEFEIIDAKDWVVRRYVLEEPSATTVGKITHEHSLDDERREFEAAAYRHYLDTRQKRAVWMDTSDAARPEEVFARTSSGEYVAVIYNAAWWGWRAAKGVL